jgi:hypothetical protein
VTPRQKVAEARRALELSARQHVALEYTVDGWRLSPVDVDRVLADAPPLADELSVVAS